MRSLLGIIACWLAISALAGAPELAAATSCVPVIQSVMAVRSQEGERPQQGWESVTLPDRWHTRWPDYDGSVWYRIDWQHPCSTDVALLIDSIVMAGEVFVNDERLWRDQDLTEPLSRSWAMARYWQLPPSLLQNGHNTLWLRVVGHAANGGGLGVVMLDAPHRLYPVYQRHRWHARTLPLINLAASSLFGCLAFILWLVSPRNPVLGWYSLVAACWVLLGGSSLMLTTWPFSSSFMLAKAHSFLYFFFLGGFSLFVWHLLSFPLPKWLQKSLLPTACGAVLWIALAQDWSSLKSVGDIASLLFLANSLYLMVRSLRSARLEHRIIGLVLLILLLVSVRDLLLLLGLIQSRIFLTHYTFLLFLVATAWMVGRNMLQNARRIERFNEELTASVAQARADLRTTLASEHQLALANTRLQERLQLAHDLHDGLGGQIVRSIIQVEQTQQPLSNQKFLAILKLLRNDLRQLVDSGTSAGAEVPATPEIWGASLRRRFTILFDELNICLHWHLPVAWHSRPSALQCLLLARVVEEALTNVLKHSQANRVDVGLDIASPGQLRLWIEDNGIGFDVEALQGTVPGIGFGVGIESVKARIQRLNGTLQLTSQPGKTRLQAYLPIASSADASLNTVPSAARISDSSPL